jgi:hypothetical protein
MVNPEAVVYLAGIEVSDRLGRHANADDGWFDADVKYWTGPDGVRLSTLELSDLGRQMVRWILGGEISIPRAIFEEMEAIVIDGMGTELGGLHRDYCLELLETLDAELMELHESDAEKFRAVKSLLPDLMGDETQLAWTQVRSEGYE